MNSGAAVNEAAQSGSLWSTALHVQRWREGDKDALGQLCLRFSPMIRARILGSRTWPALTRRITLEDAEQEVWARVLRSGSEAFQDRGRRGGFVAWLAQIVDSTVVDTLRRMEAEKRGGGRDPDVLDSLAEARKLRRPGQASLLSPSGEARVSEFEELAGSVLTPRELDAWRWVVLEGYTSEEAAMGLDCSSAAVRGLLLRSREKLQKALKASRGGDDGSRS